MFILSNMTPDGSYYISKWSVKNSERFEGSYDQNRQKPLKTGKNRENRDF